MRSIIEVMTARILQIYNRELIRTLQFRFYNGQEYKYKIGLLHCFKALFLLLAKLHQSSCF